MCEETEIIAKMYSCGGGENEPINLDTYLNQGGLITISLDDDKWIELSAIHAKILRERLDRAIRESLTQHLASAE